LGRALQLLAVNPVDRGHGGRVAGNLFANRLLVPTSWYAHDARTAGCNLLQLKKKYKTVSQRCWRWSVDLGEPCITVDNDTVSAAEQCLAGGEGDGAGGVEVPAVRQSVQPADGRRGRLTVQGWPVHLRLEAGDLRSVRDSLE
jgi:hypothetical protein